MSVACFDQMLRSARHDVKSIILLTLAHGCGVDIAIHEAALSSSQVF